MRLRFFYIILTQFLILLSYIFMLGLLGQNVRETFMTRFIWLIIMMGIHLVLALLFDKYNFSKRTGLRSTLFPVLFTNFTLAALVGLVFLLSEPLVLPRKLFFGTLALMTVFELFLGTLIYMIRSLKTTDFFIERVPKKVTTTKKPSEERIRRENERVFVSVHGQYICQSVVEEFGEEILQYLSRKVPLGPHSIVLSTNTRLNILSIPSERLKSIVNLSLINNHRYVNKFFETVNIHLPKGGFYCGCCETKEMRKQNFLKRYCVVPGWFLYSMDFLWTRLAPKIPIAQKIYFSITKGKNRVMSRAEILGRLYSCGFEVVDESYVNDRLFFVARKKRKPYYDMAPTYGPFIRLQRVGKDGKIIGVYKMRTMHPFAEYLQPYIYELNKLDEGGKFHDDFRISTLGCIMRKLWIDELPMLINWLKGELKLVGVRPLSQHYFNLYSEKLQQERIKTKPGLVPPYYADMPATFEEIEASELRYLEAWKKRPVLTDWVYFWKAFYNIVFRRARSK